MLYRSTTYSYATTLNIRHMQGVSFIAGNGSTFHAARISPAVCAAEMRTEPRAAELFAAELHAAELQTAELCAAELHTAELRQAAMRV